ncbi:hypothetical protein EJ07DRAFT_155703 [Lizonia empirigonia]|nr:hypothetical protein EJ07DRAFT_155703 [Lizonia empirigonia]
MQKGGRSLASITCACLLPAAYVFRHNGSVAEDSLTAVNFLNSADTCPTTTGTPFSANFRFYNHSSLLVLILFRPRCNVCTLFGVSHLKTICHFLAYSSRFAGIHASATAVCIIPQPQSRQQPVSVDVVRASNTGRQTVVGFCWHTTNDKVDLVLRRCARRSAHDEYLHPCLMQDKKKWPLFCLLPVLARGYGSRHVCFVKLELRNVPRSIKNMVQFALQLSRSIMSSSPQRQRVVDPTANSRLLRSGSRQTPATGPPPSAIQDVSTLPTRTEFLSTSIIPLKSAPPGTQCSICVEAVTSDIVKVCPHKHTFHSKCIRLWFEGNEERNSRCTNCSIHLFRPNLSSVVPAEPHYPRAIDADHNMINDPPDSADCERLIALRRDFADTTSLALENVRRFLRLATDVRHRLDVHNHSARDRRRSASPRDRETQDAKRLRRSARLA